MRSNAMMRRRALILTLLALALLAVGCISGLDDCGTNDVVVLYDAAPGEVGAWLAGLRANSLHPVYLAAPGGERASGIAISRAGQQGRWVVEVDNPRWYDNPPWPSGECFTWLSAHGSRFISSMKEACGEWRQIRNSEMEAAYFLEQAAQLHAQGWTLRHFAAYGGGFCTRI
jgi:hypothetical protein